MLRILRLPFLHRFRFRFSLAEVNNGRFERSVRNMSGDIRREISDISRCNKAGRFPITASGYFAKLLWIFRDVPFDETLGKIRFRQIPCNVLPRGDS